jgi:hypothetical protein
MHARYYTVCKCEKYIHVQVSSKWDDAHAFSTSDSIVITGLKFTISLSENILDYWFELLRQNN